MLAAMVSASSNRGSRYEFARGVRRRVEEQVRKRDEVNAAVGARCRLQ